MTLNLFSRSVVGIIIISLVSSCAPTATDIDGNKYNIITIGEQEWLDRNLEVGRYRNGDTIPHITDQETWANTTMGAWCYYNNDPANGRKYGKLYNWYALTDPRGLTPEGYSIPSRSDWEALLNAADPFKRKNQNKAGGKLKSRDDSWKSPNENATNATGFSALPGGYRTNEGIFESLTRYAFWWSSSEVGKNTIFVYRIANFKEDLQRGANHPNTGLSVRCIKNNVANNEVE